MAHRYALVWFFCGLIHLQSAFGQNMAIKADMFVGPGTLVGIRMSGINIDQSLQNQGSVEIDGTLVLTASSSILNNTGRLRIQTVGAMLGNLENYGKITNTDSFLIDNNLRLYSNSSFTNNSRLRVMNNINTVLGSSLNNGKSIIAAANIDLKGDYRGTGNNIGAPDQIRLIDRSLSTHFNFGFNGDTLGVLVLPNGAKNRILTDSFIVRTGLFLEAGLLVTSTNKRPILLCNANILKSSAASYINGSLVYRCNATSDRFFPIGNSTQYRPFTLKSAQTTGAIEGAYMSAVSATTDNSVYAASAGRWFVYPNTGFRQADKVILRYLPADLTTVSDSAQAVVIESNSATGTYRSLGFGGSSFYNSSATSAYGTNLRFFTVAKAYQTVASASLFLEGAYDDTSSTMHTNLDVELKRFQNTIPPPPLPATPTGFKQPLKYMALGSTVPSGAVDIVELSLRATPTGSDLASSFAWLMKDGTLLDYETGTQAGIRFGKVAGNNYYMVVRHRNHLAIMSASADSANKRIYSDIAVGFNLSKFTNIYGGMAASPDVSNAVAAMIAGDNHQADLLNIVNGIDFYRVMQDNSNLVSGYVPTDLNMDNNVNASDFNISSISYDQLYYSSVP